MGEVLSVFNVSVLLLIGFFFGCFVGFIIEEWAWKKIIVSGLSIGWWHRLTDLRKSGLYKKYGFLK